MAHPAYDQCIKASHLFNLLDARGVISVTERQAYIGRVRALAKGCADAFVQTEAGGGSACHRCECETQRPLSRGPAELAFNPAAAIADGDGEKDHASSGTAFMITAQRLREIAAQRRASPEDEQTEAAAPARRARPSKRGSGVRGPKLRYKWKKPRNKRP